MKHIIIFLFAIGLASCQTDYNIIDSGTSNGKHDVSMYEYLKSDDYNFSMAVEMIEKGGLDSLFQGLDPAHPQITFLGITNNSIRRWLYNPPYLGGLAVDSIGQVDSITCRNMILRHVIDSRYLRDEIPRGDISGIPATITGGVYVKGMADNEIFMYTLQSPYNGIANTGPVRIYLASIKLNFNNEPYVSGTGDVASSDIETTSGVVQAMQYNYDVTIL